MCVTFLQRSGYAIAESLPSCLVTITIDFFSKSAFSKTLVRNTNRASDSLDPDRAKQACSGSKLSIDDTSRQRVKIYHFSKYT